MWATPTFPCTRTVGRDDSADKRSNCEELEDEHGDSGKLMEDGNAVELD